MVPRPKLTSSRCKSTMDASAKLRSDMSNDRNYGANTDRRGRPGAFRRGNPGRPRGARNKSTLAAMALLEGEAEALTRKAVELALGGDTVALKLVLDRILPRERLVRARFAAAHPRRSRLGYLGDPHRAGQGPHLPIRDGRAGRAGRGAAPPARDYRARAAYCGPRTGETSMSTAGRTDTGLVRTRRLPTTREPSRRGTVGEERAGREEDGPQHHE